MKPFTHTMRWQSLSAGWSRRVELLRAMRVVLVVFGVVVASGIASSGLAVGAAAGPTVSVSDGTTTVGGTTTVRVLLSSAPDGVSGFNVSVALQNGTVGKIVDVSYSGSFAINDTIRGQNGDRVHLTAVDLAGNVEPGATDILLAEVTIKGTARGSSGIALTVNQLDDDAGGVVQPALNDGTLTVGAENEAPRAALTATHSTPFIGQSITLNASGSRDPDGVITKYKWDFDGDGTVDARTQLPTVTTSYSTAGTVTPSVTVVDGDGATATASTSIDVREQSAPTIELIQPDTTGKIHPGTSVSVRITDPALSGGSVTLSGSAGIPDTQFAPDSSELTIDGLTFSGEGPVTVSVQATNRNGVTQTRTFEFTMVERPTITSLAPGEGALVNESATLTARYTDDRSGIDTSTVTVAIDGTPISGVSVGQNQLSIPLSRISGLSDGEHTLTLTLADNAGFTARKTTTFTLDTTPPALTLRPERTARVSTNRPVSFAIAVTDRSSATATLTIRNATTGTVVSRQTVSPTAAGTATIDWNATTADGVPVPSGTYAVTLAARDAAANHAATTTQVTVDNTRPTIAIQDVRNSSGPLVAADTATKLPASDTIVVNLSVNGTPPAPADTAVTAVLDATFTNYEYRTAARYTDSGWQATINATALPDDGTYVLTAAATDPAQNTNTTTAATRIRVDRQPPRLGATVTREDSGTGRITLTTSEPIIRDTLNVTVTAPDGSTTRVAMTAVTGGYTGTFPLAASGSQYRVTATATDAAGNRGRDTAAATIETVSTTNRTVTVRSPATGTFIRFNTSRNVEETFISLTASDTALDPLTNDLIGASFLNGQLGKKLTRNLTNATIGIPVRGSELPSSVSPEAVTISRYNETRNEWVPVDTSVQTITLPNGVTDTYWVTTVSGFSTYGAVVDDTVAPRLTASSPSGALSSGQTAATVRFEYADAATGVNASAVELYFDGRAVTTAASASITSDYATYNATNLAAGTTYTGTVRVVDEAGNAKTYSTQFTVKKDTTAPTIEKISPPDGAKLPASTNTVTISVAYNDTLSGVNQNAVRVFFDGVDVTSNATIGPSRLTYTATNLSANSTHQVRVALTDAAGNGPRERTVSFSINASQSGTASDTGTGGGGGGGGGSLGGEFSVNHATRSFGHVVTIAYPPNEQVSVDIGVSGAGVTVQSLAVNPDFEPATLEVYVFTPTQSPTTARALGIGKPVSYVRMDLREGKARNVGRLGITFTVDESALPAGVSPEQVTLYRYQDRSWAALDTQHVSGNTYRAASPGFASEFAVGIQPAAQTSTTTSTSTTTTTTTTTTATSGPPTTSTTTPRTTTITTTAPGFSPLLAVLACLIAGLWRRFSPLD